MTFKLKAIIVGVMLSASVTFWVWDRQQQYNAGFNSAALKHEKGARESLERRISEAIGELDLALKFRREEAQTATQKATELNQLLDGLKVTLDDINEYEKMDAEADCPRLGDEFFRLYNQPLEGWEGRSRDSK